MSVIDLYKKSLQDKQALLRKQIAELYVPLYPTVFRTKANLQRNKTAQKNNPKLDVSRSFAVWSQAEDEILKKEFFNGNSPAMLSKVHKRTSGAIESRLSSLGLLK